MSKFSKGDPVQGDPGTTNRETGKVLEVDPAMKRYLVLWDSGLTYWHEESELEAKNTSNEGARHVVVDEDEDQKLEGDEFSDDEEFDEEDARDTPPVPPPSPLPSEK